MASISHGAKDVTPYARSQAGISAWEADQFYRQGDYARAAAAYQALVQASPDDPYLHYNLGNAYFKEGASGSLGRAIAEYWRAYRILPRDPDIRHNLDFALKRAGESLVPAGMPQTLHRAFHGLSLAELLGLQWICFWLCMLLGSAYLLKEGLRLKLRPGLSAAIILWLCFGAWWGLLRTAEIQDAGVILEPNAEARSGPGLNFPVNFNAPEGRRVSILSSNGEWLEIGMIKEGLKGWVLSRAVEKI